MDEREEQIKLVQRKIADDLEKTAMGCSRCLFQTHKKMCTGLFEYIAKQQITGYVKTKPLCALERQYRVKVEGLATNDKLLEETMNAIHFENWNRGYFPAD
ncbi:MAG: hypothetical protein FWD89_03030 [Firmicutes bacterium]|nr:hypothetical protein [Bacillota bacterium]MCL2771263.1 hypothetical protein [Bacillota bacterium]